MQRLDQSQITFTNNKNIKPNKLPLKIQIYNKCIAKNILSYFCINRQCENFQKFMCNNSKCKCNEKHFQCIKESIDTILVAINQKIFQNIDKMKENISQIFTKLIDKISQFQQNCLKQVDNQLKFANLTKLQQKFYTIFAQHKELNVYQFDFYPFQQLLQNIKINKNQINDTGIFIKYLQEIQNYSKKLC